MQKVGQHRDQGQSDQSTNHGRALPKSFVHKKKKVFVVCDVFHSPNWCCGTTQLDDDDNCTGAALSQHRNQLAKLGEAFLSVLSPWRHALHNHHRCHHHLRGRLSSPSNASLASWQASAGLTEHWHIWLRNIIIIHFNHISFVSNRATENKKIPFLGVRIQIKVHNPEFISVVLSTAGNSRNLKVIWHHAKRA